MEKKSQESEKTTVVRLKRKAGAVIQDCDIYIGRKMHMGGWKLPESEWANPFSVKDSGSNKEACRRYEDYQQDKRPDLIERLHELKGKVLGCWCKPEECHGDVLVRLLAEQDLKESPDNTKKINLVNLEENKDSENIKETNPQKQRFSVERIVTSKGKIVRSKKRSQEEMLENSKQDYNDPKQDLQCLTGTNTKRIRKIDNELMADNISNSKKVREDVQESKTKPRPIFSTKKNLELLCDVCPK